MCTSLILDKKCGLESGEVGSIETVCEYCMKVADEFFFTIWQPNNDGKLLQRKQWDAIVL